MQKAAATLDLDRFPRAKPGFLEPMKARLELQLPETDDWMFEVKFDGIRAIAVKDGKGVSLFSRRPRDLTSSHPEIAKALSNLQPKKFVLDGEIAALDQSGRTSFQALQNLSRQPATRDRVFFLVFDLLNLNGRDLTAATLSQRRLALEKIVGEGVGPIRLSAALNAPPAKIWKLVVKLGLEGIIAKRRDSTYESGKRSGAWVKVKAQQEQEFVIGGYTPPQGTREYFGSVLVGYYEGKKLMFASKVGTGFDRQRLRTLHTLFTTWETPHCPFANLPTRRLNRFGQGITVAEMKRCTWLKPRLVCQVRFLEWTEDHSLRQPVFLGLRDDKKASQVFRETPSAAV
jgi:bifunctional non-homologous end joining protein LigD